MADGNYGRWELMVDGIMTDGNYGGWELMVDGN